MYDLPRLRVAVLMGGPSPEHHVSLASGRHVVRQLSREDYEIIPVEVGQDGRWRAFDYDAYLPVAMAESVEPADLAPVREGIEQVLTADPGIDVAFIAMHGPYGEDGTVQAILDGFDVPYTGSGVQASAAAMSKLVSKAVFESHEVLTPEWQEARVATWNPDHADAVAEELGLPLMVKADCSGSSLGVYLCRTVEEVRDAVEAAFTFDPRVLLEEYLEGIELTVPVAGDSLREPPTPLAPTQIVPAGAFFDYESKYSDPNTREITPAPVPENILRACRVLAARAHYALGCAGITRTDMIWVQDREFEDGQPYIAVLEVNTIPGMTPASIIPRALEATGGDFADLLVRLLEQCLPVEEGEPDA